CGSGLKAVALGAQAISAGDAHVVVAGGMESMSNAPYLVRKARWGLRMGNEPFVDSMLQDGLLDPGSGVHMGITAENVAERCAISRADQDALASESVRRALAGVKIEQLELIEANEAFAAQALAVARALRLPPQITNVSGGAIALGHPIGASGCRILVTLMHGMRRLSRRLGLATLCIGGGQGIAMVVERTVVKGTA